MKITLIGYGEVGRILAEDLRAKSHAVKAFDIKLASDEREPLRAHALLHKVNLAESHADAVRGAELVISAVTASQTVTVARACSPALSPRSFFLDLNSASPGSKIAAADHVAGVGGRFVEGAVMTAVPPYRMRVPLLVGGPHAATAKPVLDKLGFAAWVASEKLGVASATKMCRSVMIKGLEAMVIESFTAARFHGVEDALIASLRETFPGVHWEKQAAYLFQRVIEHGARRSEEVLEAAATVREAGLEPLSASATAARQNWIAALADEGLFGARSDEEFARSPDFRVEADRILSYVKGTER